MNIERIKKKLVWFCLVFWMPQLLLLETDGSRTNEKGGKI